MNETIPVARLCRLERLEGDQWVVVGDYSLLYPHRYPERLAVNGKIGRATVLDEHLAVTGEVYTSPDVEVCPMCSAIHPAPFDGRCLL